MWARDLKHMGLWLHADVDCPVPNQQIIEVRNAYDAAIHRVQNVERRKAYKPITLNREDTEFFKALL